jgi:uncharacterized membrane protein YadS
MKLYKFAAAATATAVAVVVVVDTIYILHYSLVYSTGSNNVTNK